MRRRVDVMHEATLRKRASRAQVFKPGHPQRGLHVGSEHDASWLNQGPEELRFVLCAEASGKVMRSLPSGQGLGCLHQAFTPPWGGLPKLQCGAAVHRDGRVHSG